MAEKKYLSEKEIAGFLDKKEEKKGKDQEEFSEVSLCVPGDKVFFEPEKLTEDDWYQKENLKYPYYLGTIQDMSQISTGNVKIKAIQDCPFLDQGKVMEYPISKMCAFSDEADRGIPDMVDLDKLNNATLLHNLKSRYNTDPKEIYTYVTPSLLVMNPYRKVPHLMTPEILEACKQYVDSDKMTLKDIVPHTYSIAGRALKQMYTNKERQAIVISGESGAGKTEAAKIAMSFLTSSSGVKKEPGTRGIEDRIIACNPVLEAFGNAKTPRNYNSSRFGKYVKIIFNIKTRQIMGAITKPYLLEKSRIVKITDLDRNYHIFYMVMKGSSEEMLEKLCLLDKDGKKFTKDNFEYLKYGCDNIPERYINDIELYNELFTKITEELAFTKEEQMTIWKIIAAVLFLGNIDLDENAYDEVKNKPCKAKNRDALEKASKLLGCKPDDLEYEVTYRGTVGDAKRAVCNPKEAFNQTDSLSKTLYNNLFSWLVKRMNEKILDDPSLQESTDPNIKTIGLLDIFGFECFVLNDYEQMLINYTNEKLQKLYLNAVFEAEKVIFKEEGLSEMIGKLQYTDRTTSVIEMLDNKTKGKPQGIFNKIDDYKKNEDSKALQSAIKKDFQKHENYRMHKDQDKFYIIHTAKLVIYSASGFIEKNLDKMSDDLKTMMWERMDSQISEIMKAEKDASMGNTIWKKFSFQMKDLMDELAESFVTGKRGPKDIPTELHFVRCIKPNEKANHDLFVDTLVLMQITYMGVLDTIKVRKMNYPNRIKYIRFYERYEDMCSKSLSTPFRILQLQNPDYTALSRQLISEQFGEMGQNTYAFGTTRIFCNNEFVAALEEGRQRAQSKKAEATLYIQDSYAAHGKRQIYKRKIVRVRALQKYYHRHLEKTRTMQALKFILHISEAIQTFRTEKRKAIEENACKKITQVATATCIKEIFISGIHRRQLVMQEFARINGRQKITKVALCRSLSYLIFRKAWSSITGQMLDDASEVLGIISKAFAARQLFADKLVKAKEKAEFIKTTKASLVLQKKISGILIRRKLHVLNMAAKKIQGFLRSKWMRDMFSNIVKAAIIIQRRYKKYTGIRKELMISTREFRNKHTIIAESSKMLERVVLFGRDGSEKINSSLFMYRSSLEKALEESLKRAESGNIILQHLKETNSFSPQKVSVFTLVCDQHLMADITPLYTDSWAVQFADFCTDMFDTDSSVLEIQNGIAHSVGVNSKGQVYCWGTNTHYQCGVPNKLMQVKYDKKNPLIFGESRVKQVACGRNHSLFLDEEGNVFAWGQNSQGQLGLGHFDDCCEPQRIISGLPDGDIKQIAVCEDLNFAITKESEAYMWPTKDDLFSPILIPRRLPFSPTVKIESVSCGRLFVMLLTSDGSVYSFGSENHEGQLGLGDTKEHFKPELIKSLKEKGENIRSVSCGFQHTVARSSLGKVYTWGYNGNGQLGQGNFTSCLTPKIINTFKDSLNSKEPNSGKKKILQVAAGYSHTIILTDTRVPYWCGTNQNLDKCPVFIKINLEKLFPELFVAKPSALSGKAVCPYTIVKINSSWSYTMSLTSLVILDFRALPGATASSNAFSSQLGELCRKWSANEIDPPYIETIAKYFSANIMRKPGGSKKKVVSRSSFQPYQLLHASLKKGIKGITEITDSNTRTKVKEIVQRLLNACSKEPEKRTGEEAALVAHFLAKISH